MHKKEQLLILSEIQNIVYHWVNDIRDIDYTEWFNNLGVNDVAKLSIFLNKVREYVAHSEEGFEFEDE